MLSRLTCCRTFLKATRKLSRHSRIPTIGFSLFFSTHTCPYWPRMDSGSFLRRAPPPSARIDCSTDLFLRCSLFSRSFQLGQSPIPNVTFSFRCLCMRRSQQIRFQTAMKPLSTHLSSKSLKFEPMASEAALLLCSDFSSPFPREVASGACPRETSCRIFMLQTALSLGPVNGLLLPMLVLSPSSLKGPSSSESSRVSVLPC